MIDASLGQIQSATDIWSLSNTHTIHKHSLYEDFSIDWLGDGGRPVSDQWQAVSVYLEQPHPHI